MIQQAQVPEIGDGGYWYVATAIPADDSPGWTFDQIPKGCAWYAEIGGTQMVAVRSPDAVATLPQASLVTVSEILAQDGYSAKPFGRVGGL